MTTPFDEAIPSLWNDSEAADLGAAELLLYRSNLLGADLRVTNFAGGNTSAKLGGRDPLSGSEVEVLWVKGSGGDLGSMTLAGFATLYQVRVVGLEAHYRGREHEDEMVGFLPHCTFDLNPRAASIDTPLHAFVPHAHVDHMHPDAVIALAAAKDGEALTREIFGETIAWLPWQRPGFDLGLAIGRVCREQPEARGIVLGGHGLFTWASTAKECYEHTLATINRAAAYLSERSRPAPFGDIVCKALPAEQRVVEAARMAPVLRGALSAENPKVGHFTDERDVLEFLASERLGELAALGTSCPDHFLRTKIWPLVIDWVEDEEPAVFSKRVATALSEYRAGYSAYYERCKREGSPPLRDPYPVILLVPRVGMFAFAKDKATARVSAEFYVNAIHVMRGAEGVSSYVGLPEQEAFDIEYWALEEAKLQRQPPPRPLAGRVAVVTGGAGAIGRACAERFLREGANVMLVDVDEDALTGVDEDLARLHGRDRVRRAHCDVTSEDSVRAAFSVAALEFGGVDLLVSNAGIASSAPIEETSLELWNRNQAILSTGYFLVAREAFRCMKEQGRGGSIVFIGSKNALAASAMAAAYNVAKASELHLARCLALEGAPHGIRANVVNPDAVLRGSKIWSGSWRSERAAAYGIEEGELEEHYRKRSLLGRSVFPEDVAEAVYFFAGETASKSTGNILNVDAGNLTAFPR